MSYAESPVTNIIEDQDRQIKWEKYIGSTNRYAHNDCV